MRLIKNNKGFTLLEILITTFIFSFAMLSLALMQMNGMKHGNSASLQSVANMQTIDILERMRVNRNDVLANNYDISRTSEAACSGLHDAEFETCLSGLTQQWNKDLAQWRHNLEELLPSGTGSIACNASGRCTINSFWNSIHPNPDSPLAPDELNFTIVSQL